MPIPPAAETAATSSGLLHGYIAPQISGTSMPSCSVNRVDKDGRIAAIRHANTARGLLFSIAVG